MRKQEARLPGLARDGVHQDGKVENRDPDETENGVVDHSFIIDRDASLPRGNQPTLLRALAGCHAGVIHEVGILVQPVHSLSPNVKGILGPQDTRPRFPFGMKIPHAIAKPPLLGADVVVDFVRYKMALGVVKDHVPARHYVARCAIEGGFVGGHSHVFVNN